MSEPLPPIVLPPSSDLSLISALIKNLESNPDSYEFLQPVDYIGLGLHDYPSIIKTPMDISSVKAKLQNGQYATTEAALMDLQLIWDNCRHYNMSDSTIVHQANNMEKQMKRVCQTLKLDYDGALLQKRLRDQENQVPHEDKLEFTRLAKKASEPVLAEVVRLIQQRAPRCIENTDTNRLRIRVDDLDKLTFAEVMEVVRRCEEPVSS